MVKEALVRIGGPPAVVAGATALVGALLAVADPWPVGRTLGTPVQTVFLGLAGLVGLLLLTNRRVWTGLGVGLLLVLHVSVLGVGWWSGVRPRHEIRQTPPRLHQAWATDDGRLLLEGSWPGPPGVPLLGKVAHPRGLWLVDVATGRGEPFLPGRLRGAGWMVRPTGPEVKVFPSRDEIDLWLGRGTPRYHVVDREGSTREIPPYPGRAADPLELALWMYRSRQGRTVPGAVRARLAERIAGRGDLRLTWVTTDPESIVLVWTSMLDGGRSPDDPIDLVDLSSGRVLTVEDPGPIDEIQFVGRSAGGPGLLGRRGSPARARFPLAPGGVRASDRVSSGGEPAPGRS